MQKAQLERKVREIHRLIRALGTTAAALPESPIPAILKKSPKKINLSNIKPECSPDRSTIDFISARSKPRSLNTGPSRVSRSASKGEDEGIYSMSGCSDAAAQSTTRERSSEDMEHIEQDFSCEKRHQDRDREARRSSRRISRSSGEIVPLQPQDFDHSEVNMKESNVQEAKSHRRRSRSSAIYETALLAASNEDISLVNQEERPKDHERPFSTLDLYNDDKENAPSQRGPNAAIRLLHSSPVKSRTALNLIADPLPSLNIQQVVQQTPVKTVAEITEVKAEPESPMLSHASVSGDRAHGVAEESGRSRRGKSVNYAEPSLRVKMRRTESLPGDKRRKSSYRRSSAAIDRPSSSKSTITIDED